MSGYATLDTTINDGVMTITLNRPRAKNAMNQVMVAELIDCFMSLQKSNDIRVVVLRGSEQMFCAGADIKDMAAAKVAVATENLSASPVYQLNRSFGTLLTAASEIPQVLVAVVEGAALGGGFGLVCVSDIAISHTEAQFGLPETGLGIVPAQIAPFVVQRIGLTQTRRLALTGARFDGRHAAELGIVHAAVTDVYEALQDTLTQVLRCAPQANASTKRIMQRVGQLPLHEQLDKAAEDFVAAINSAEGQEGTLAFVQKRKPNWQG